jgi:hypothetical protein
MFAVKTCPKERKLSASTMPVNPVRTRSTNGSI